MIPVFGSPLNPRPPRPVKIKKGPPRGANPFFFTNLGARAAPRLVVVAVAGGPGRLGFPALLLLLPQDGLAGELNLVALLADALDHDLLPLLEFVAHVADAVLGDLGDVQQASVPGKISTKAPKSTMRETVPR